jgi:hypothetical protein
LTKSIRPNGIPNFIIKGCSETFIPALRHIFNRKFLSWEISLIMEAVVPIFKKCNEALIVDYRPISIVNNFSKIFISSIYNHLSFNFKSKLKPNQHGFLISKSTLTNLITYLNDVALPVVVLMDKLNQFGLF